MDEKCGLLNIPFSVSPVFYGLGFRAESTSGIMQVCREKNSINEISAIGGGLHGSNNTNRIIILGSPWESLVY